MKGKVLNDEMGQQFFNLALDHAIARDGLDGVITRADCRFAAVMIIAQQPFFEPFYGSAS